MKNQEHSSATADRRPASGTEFAESDQRVRKKGCQRAAAPVVRPGYLRKADAAKYLNVSIRTLTEWMQKRIVPYAKLSHRVCLFRQADLDTAMNRFRTEAIG